MPGRARSRARLAVLAALVVLSAPQLTGMAPFGAAAQAAVLPAAQEHAGPAPPAVPPAVGQAALPAVPPAVGQPLPPAVGQARPGPLPGEATSRPLGLPVALAVLACAGVASLLVRVLLAEPAARRPRC